MDKVGRNTGPGKFKESVIEKRPRLIARIDLYNYNVDGNLLKPEHQEYLRRKMVPLLKNAPVHVKLTGRASQSGDQEYNRTLSLERVLRVKRFLTGHGIPESKVPGTQMHAVGEDYSTSISREDEWDRGVSLTIAWGTKRFPIITDYVPVRIVIEKKKEEEKKKKRTRKPPPPPKGNRSWKIMDLGSADLKIGTGQLFWIVDKTHQEEVICSLVGRTVLPGVGLAPVSGKGEWSDFETKDPHDLSDFGDWASYSTPPSVLFWSAGKAYLTIRGISKGSIPVETGVTIGADSSSTTAGYMVCTTPAPYKPRWYRDFITGKWVLD